MNVDRNVDYGNKKTIFLELGNDTPHVVTTMVAA
jgi:hypothetical protein